MRPQHALSEQRASYSACSGARSARYRRRERLARKIGTEKNQHGCLAKFSTFGRDWCRHCSGRHSTQLCGDPRCRKFTPRDEVHDRLGLLWSYLARVRRRLNNETPALKSGRELTRTSRDFRRVCNLDLEVRQRDRGVNGRLDGNRVGRCNSVGRLRDPTIARAHRRRVAVDVTKNEETEDDRGDRNDDRRRRIQAGPNGCRWSAGASRVLIHILNRTSPSMSDGGIAITLSRVWELNPRPTAYKAVALPLS